MKGWIALGCGVVLLSIAAVELSAAPADGGPLAEQLAPNAVTVSVTAGASFTYGGVQLRPNASAGAVTLEGVRLEELSPGLEVVDAYVLPIAETNDGLWFSYERFPPPGLPRAGLRPFNGFTLDASGEVQVLLELRAADEGTYEFRAFSIEYRTGGRRYRATYPFAMRACAAKAGSAICPVLRAPG